MVFVSRSALLSRQYSLNRWVLLLAAVILFLFSLLRSSSTMADDLTMTLGTYHHDDGGQFNDFNPGLIYRKFLNDKYYVQGGGYYNSEEAPSFMLGAGREFPLTKNLDLGVSGGLITGYKRAPVMPYVMPSLKYKDRFVVTPLPSRKKNGDLGWGLNFAVKLKEF
jgi:hypothetical protein